MAIETFPFIYHQVKAAYPQRNSQVNLGGGWTHTIKPASKPARKLILTFSAMKYFTNDLGVVDETQQKEINLHALDLFYQQHELHRSFLYDHYAYGTLEVLFAKPFELPDLIKNGDGASRGFTLELIEQIR